MDDWLDRALELPGAKRYEHYVAALCPFHHDSKPSLLVFEDGFLCLACGERGSLEYLFHTKLTPRRLPTPTGACLPRLPNISDSALARSAHDILVSSVGLQDYLAGRGLERAINLCNLGYWDGWYTIPITYQDGEVRGIIFRASPMIQKQTGSRFYQRLHQRPMLYVPDWGSLDKSYLFITFGMFDAITLCLAGFPAVTSTSGKDSFDPDWLDWWNGYIYIVPDLLEESSAHKLASKLGWRGRVVQLNYPDNCKDPNDWWQLNPEELKKAIYESVGNIPNSRRSMSPAR